MHAYRTQSTSHPAYCVMCGPLRLPTTSWQPRTTRVGTIFAVTVKLPIPVVMVTAHSVTGPPAH